MKQVAASQARLRQQLALEKKEGEQFSFNQLDWSFNLVSYIQNKITFDDEHLHFWNLLFELVTTRSANAGFSSVYAAIKDKMDRFPADYADTVDQAFYRQAIKDLFNRAFGIYDPAKIDGLNNYWCLVMYNTPSRIVAQRDPISTVINFKAENDEMAFDMLFQAWMDEERTVRSWQVVNLYDEQDGKSFSKMEGFAKYLGEEMTKAICF